MKHELSYKDPTKKPTGKALTAELVAASDMFVREIDDGIAIEIHGALAHLPGLKQNLRASFRGGFPKINTSPELVSAMKALDELYQRLGYMYDFGTDEIGLCVIHAHWGRKFDVMSGFETISDWLEPAHKSTAKRARGWGIGIIADDCQVIPWTIRDRHLGVTCDYTRIFIRRWEAIAERAIGFTLDAFLL